MVWSLYTWEIKRARGLTLVRRTNCEKPRVQGMDVRIVVHLDSDRAHDLAKMSDGPPTAWRRKTKKFHWLNHFCEKLFPVFMFAKHEDREMITIKKEEAHIPTTSNLDWSSAAFLFLFLSFFFFLSRREWSEKNWKLQLSHFLFLVFTH